MPENAKAASAIAPMIALLVIFRFCVVLYPVMIPHPLCSESQEFNDRISPAPSLIFKSLAVYVPSGFRHLVVQSIKLVGAAKRGAAEALSEDLELQDRTS